MMTTTCCSSPAAAASSGRTAAGAGRMCRLQTIWVTGIGESFSSCNSTIACVSSKELLGSSMTRRKTCSGGSHATFSRGCQSELHDLATHRDGSDSPPGIFCSRSRTKSPPFASNRQRRFASGATCRMLQECQRAMIQLRIADCGLRMGTAGSPAGRIGNWKWGVEKFIYSWCIALCRHRPARPCAPRSASRAGPRQWSSRRS